MTKSKQLSKLEKEVRRLSITSFKETDSALFNHYKEALKEMKVELKEYIDAYDELSFSKRLEAERQIQIANKIDNILIDLNKWSESGIRKSIESEANFGYYGTWYALEGAENIQLNFSMLPEKYIKELVNKPVNGKRFSKRLYDNRKALAEQVTTSLLNGVTRGHSYEKIAKQIGELTEADYKKSLRIARTEGGRVRSITKQQSYEEAKNKGVDIQKQWVATLDKKTRHQHASLDGQTVEIEEQFKFEGHKADGPRLFGVAGLDINCRCTTITIVNGVSPEVRRDSESKEVIDYKNYNEWAEDKGINSTKSQQDSVENAIIDYKVIPKNEIDDFFYNSRNYKEWSSNLAEDEIKAIRTYTGAAYADMNYINRHNISLEQYIELTKDFMDSNESKLKYQRYTKTTETLSKLLGKYTTEEPFITYRGSTHILDLNPGEVTDKIDLSFMSTSLDKDITKTFQDITTSPNRVNFTIKVPDGVNVGAYVAEHSGIKGEKEFIFKPNVKFKVVEVKELGTIQNIILEVVKKQ